MRILLLTHAFNSLTQRLYAELSALGHDLSVEFDIADSVSEEAVALFRPELIVAPYLRRRIPASIWSRHLCLVVHPGVVGDRGPSALDWAIQRGLANWGVTVLQANEQLDGGDVWAQQAFPLRAAKKASVYRHETTEAAVSALLAALERADDYFAGRWRPTPLAELLNRAELAELTAGAQRAEGPELADAHKVADVIGAVHPPMRQPDRAIDWSTMSTREVLARLNAADGFPGVRDRCFGVDAYLFDACAEDTLRGEPGAFIARRESALCRATVDGAVWIGHLKRGDSRHPFKLPATLAFAEETRDLPEAPLDSWWRQPGATWQDIAYQERGEVGYLHFAFYNGAMDTRQCQRLLAAYRYARSRPTRVIVLAGGEDFWSNGIHLNVIEAGGWADPSAAPSPLSPAPAAGTASGEPGRSVADESWANINAIDDLARELITTEKQLTVAALFANAGAGGCFLARACDEVWPRRGVILNPHYKNMGNLYGSEYWTYLLPKRVGQEGAAAIMRHRLPLAADAALAMGLVDAVLPGAAAAYWAEVDSRAAALGAAGDFAERLARKSEQRHLDEAAKPLESYRAEELAQMRRNFYGFDPSYHVARYHFVLKSPASWTPRHLARHRDFVGEPSGEPVRV